MKYFLIALLLFPITTYAKTNSCKFEISFKLDSVDDPKRCSFGFLIMDDLKFKTLSYSVENNIIKIIGNLYYEENWVDKDFPILWISKRIKGQESFHGVNNCYVQFENLKFKQEIKVNIGTMCEIEKTLIANVDDKGSIKCFDHIPQDYPTWRLNINHKNIPKKNPNH